MNKNEKTLETGEDHDKKTMKEEETLDAKVKEVEESKDNLETPQRLHSARKFVGGTPPSPRSLAGEEDPNAFPYVDGQVLTSDPITQPEEFTGGSARRQKVDVPPHLQKSCCAHCGDPRPKRRGPQCGAFDPTERKWYCYLCWRQFRQDIHDAAVLNAQGENCVTCNIYVLKNQGKYMDLGETPGTDQGLYCVHCWEGWINSLPTDTDWINNRTAQIAAENEAVDGQEVNEQERIQKEINVNATLIEAALDAGTALEEMGPKIAETEELLVALKVDNEDQGVTR